MFQQSQLSRLYLSILIICLTLFIPQSIYAQNIVSVNNLTGTANATIPIYNVAIGDLSAPVALAYNASGLKVENYDNSFGQGWRLIAPGSITREVRGFPDDVEYQSDPSYSIIKGWLRSGNAAPQTIQSLTFDNDGTSNCVNEISDATTIANNFSYTYDTEPDYFNVSAPGLNCSFVFDANQDIKIIPYRDYKITYTTGGYGKINAFTVTNENGIKYFFNLGMYVDHSIDIFNPGTTVAIDPSTLEVFKRDFMMYRNKATYAGYPLGLPVLYATQWMLSTMEDTRGNRINYSYGSNPYYSNNPSIYEHNSYKEIEILKPDGNGDFIKKKLYGVTNLSGEFHLQSISTFSPGFEMGTFQTIVQFDWAAPSGSTEDEKLIYISLPLEKKKYELLYTKKFLGSPSVWHSYGRYFLKGLKASNTTGLCDNVSTQFDFTYYAVNQADNTCYCTPVVPGNPSTILDTLKNAQDYWGYYNGMVNNTNLNPKIYVYPDNPSVELFKVYPIPNYSGTQVILTSATASSDRSVNPHAIDGSLKKITYPSGGFTELVYENNDFFDNDVNGNVLGGGIRIKTITNNDGLGTQADVTEYEYNDPINTSTTTGRAISVPKFTMAFQNSNSYGSAYDKVFNSTYRTTYDLNNEPKDILYGKVTVKKSGIGKSLYEYNTTGTFGSSSITDWEESKNYVARTNLSSPTPCIAITPSFLYLNNAALQYPFTSNPNYDFERGLLTMVTHKNEAGLTVATEEYDYDRSHTNPTKIYGVRLDEIGNTMAAYGKYAVNTVVDNFMVTKTSKLYNSNSTTPITDIETYDYTSPGSGAPYRLLKSVSKQNSGSAITFYSKYTYAKEYTPAGSGDDMNNAIDYFNTNNKNTVIESTQSFIDGSTEKITAASLNTFKPFTVGDIINGGITVPTFLPNKSYEFINQAGLTSTSFTYSTLNSGVFTWDANNYINIPTTIEQYDVRGIPQVIEDNSRIPKTILRTPLVNSLKVAEFTNAKTENIGFSNFDVGDFPGNVTLGGNAIQSGGRHSGYYLNFQPNTSLCRPITASLATKNFIISFWLKDAQTSGDIYLCGSTSSCDGSACNINPILSFTPGSQWKYYQIVVPYFTKFGLPTYYYSLSTSTAVKIDDILMYPDNANVTTYSYTTNNIGTNLLTAKNGINGVGNSYEYDNAGRLWLVRDHFDNIIEMKKYKLPNRHAGQIPSIEIGYVQPNYIDNVEGTFTAYPPMSYESGDCDVAPIQYNWDFGDGTTDISFSQPNSRGGTTINHTYGAGPDSGPDNYVVTVTASSAGMTNIPGNTPAVTSTNPLPVTVKATAGTCSTGTPNICASGITQYTSTYQCNTTTCMSLPSTCAATYFTVSSISGGSIGSVFSVQWETAPEGTSNWSVYQEEPPSGGGFITSKNFHPVNTESYQMRARVRFCNSATNGGSTAYSNTILIRNGD